MQDDELPFGEITEPSFHDIVPTMEEAELLGTATMNLVNSAIELAPYAAYEGDEETPLSLIRAVVFWANQLQELMEIQSAKAGLGMIP